MYEKSYQASNGELLAVFVTPADGNDVKGGYVKLVFGGPGALCLTPKVAADLGNDVADFVEVCNRESEKPAPANPLPAPAPSAVAAAASKTAAASKPKASKKGRRK